MKADQAFVYEHPGNKIVGVVIYNSSNGKDKEVAKELALQTVAMNPEYIKMEDIPSEIQDKFYNEFKEEVIAS